MKGTDRLRPSAGQIEVITGGMFSGKSEELLRRLRRAVIARQRVQVFQPVADSRSEPERIVTRDNRALEAVAVASSQELQEKLELGVEVVGIDEAQFFDAGLIPLVTRLADLGLRVVVAGLDQDYLRRAFGPMPELLALAEYVDKMHAVCVRCGSPAHYSQRIAGGDEQLQVGDVESYEARCRRCYEPFEASVGGEVEPQLDRGSPAAPSRVEATVTPQPRTSPQSVETGKPISFSEARGIGRAR